MPIPWIRLSVLNLIALGMVIATGCAERGNFLTGGPTVGQLKTSLSHLEYESEQLKTQVARLKEENRSMEDRLVQEQIYNGDLTARLDDARNLLRDRGIDPESRERSRSELAQESDQQRRGSRARTLPAARPSRKPRKPPAARIPGDGNIDELPRVPDDDDQEKASISLGASDSAASSRRLFRDDPGLTIRDEQLRWLPVVTGTVTPAAPRR
jgi:hypothetical protein